MKLRNNWTVVPTALALILSATTAALSDTVQTPLRSPITISGNSGGAESSCGFVPSSPNQVVVVNQPTPLRFRVEGQGQPTLFIMGPGGRNQCVMADSFSRGTIEVPGVWNTGTYSIYVGDRVRGGAPFTLSITQEN